jgi:hypothetical protein
MPLLVLPHCLFQRLFQPFFRFFQIKGLLIWAFAALAFHGAYAQDSEKSPPILFAEGYFGSSSGKAPGLTAGVALNYQFHRNLLTARYLANTDLQLGAVGVGIILLPTIRERGNLEEFSFLYGRRWIAEGHSLSLSLGLSYNTYTTKFRDPANNRFINESFYWGVPFEANVKWFKRSRERYRIYGLIPVGQPTGFGQSFGIKVFGNVSHRSFYGVGLVMGFGFHKKY